MCTSQSLFFYLLVIMSVRLKNQTNAPVWGHWGSVTGGISTAGGTAGGGKGLEAGVNNWAATSTRFPIRCFVSNAYRPPQGRHVADSPSDEWVRSQNPRHEHIQQQFHFIFYFFFLFTWLKIVTDARRIVQLFSADWEVLWCENIGDGQKPPSHMTPCWNPIWFTLDRLICCYGILTG